MGGGRELREKRKRRDDPEVKKRTTKYGEWLKMFQTPLLLPLLLLLLPLLMMLITCDR